MKVQFKSTSSQSAGNLLAGDVVRVSRGTWVEFYLILQCGQFGGAVVLLHKSDEPKKQMEWAITPVSVDWPELTLDNFCESFDLPPAYRRCERSTEVTYVEFDRYGDNFNLPLKISLDGKSIVDNAGSVVMTIREFPKYIREAIEHPGGYWTTEQPNLRPNGVLTDDDVENVQIVLMQLKQKRT